jgi:ketosteroid isomerase-like protein
MDKKLRAFMDKAELQELVYLYARAADRHDYTLMRSLYTDDAIDDHGSMFYGSADEYVKWLPSILETWDSTLHSVCNTLFAVDGDVGEGEVYKITYHRTKSAPQDEVISGGRYLDKYRRCADGKWRFTHRRLVQNWTWKRPASAAGFIPSPPGTPDARTDASDLLYTHLSMFAKGG